MILGMERILVIDDDVELCHLVGEYLQAEGFSIECVHDGESGLRKAKTGDYLLAVLDVMLPGVSGFDVLRQIRSTSRLPVLLLTARGEDVDRIVGLEIGADDYLPKPFNPRELVARIRAVLRRTRANGDSSGAAPEIVRVGDVELDPATRTVRLDGKPASSRPLTAASICTSARCARSWATPTTTSTSRRFAASVIFLRGQERRRAPPSLVGPEHEKSLSTNLPFVLAGAGALRGAGDPGHAGLSAAQFHLGGPADHRPDRGGDGI